MSETLNIYQKLAQIRKPVEVIKKNKQGYGYTYVTEDMILSKISGLMMKYNVSLIPNIIPGTTRITPYHYVKTKFAKNGNTYEEHNNEVLVQADMEWVWIDNDDPESRIIVPWALVGQQGEASQSFGSALTYSSRYFLLKYFNVATSDEDPDDFYARKREAEKAEDRLIADEITKDIDKRIKNHLEHNTGDREVIVKLIKKYVKDGNYFNIKDPDVAAKLLEDIKGITEKKETKV